MEPREGRTLAGQALVELLVAIPLLALFSTMAICILRHAMVGPWLDERIETRLLRPGDVDCEKAVVSLRQETPFPAYFGQDEVSFSQTNQKRTKAFTPLHRVLDGGIAVQEASLRTGTERARRLLPAPGLAYAGTASSRLGWWQCSQPEEGDVGGRVERILLAGLPGGGVLKWLRGMGMDPIRVDLDALPASARLSVEGGQGSP